MKSQKVVMGKCKLCVTDENQFTKDYDLPKNWFGFEALQPNAVVRFICTSNCDYEYSTSTDEEKLVWHSVPHEVAGYNSISVTLQQIRDKVYFRAKDDNTGKVTVTNGLDYGYGQFSSDVGHMSSLKVFGNIMYLQNKEGDSKIVEPNAFAKLFANDQCAIYDASELLLPATTLGDYAYQSMFAGCGGLVKGPKELPATILGGCAYNQMFQSCEKLEIAPVFGFSGNFTYNVMESMFSGCFNLKYIDISSFKMTVENLDNINTSFMYLAGSTYTDDNYSGDVVPTIKLQANDGLLTSVTVDSGNNDIVVETIDNSVPKGWKIITVE